MRHYAIHKPLPLGLHPRVSGFINPIQTSHMVYNYYIYPAQYIYSRRPTGFKLNKVLPAVLGFYVDKIPPLSEV